MKMFATMVVSLFLTACQTIHIDGRPKEGSPDFLVPAGAAWVLKRPITVPAWERQVYFQNGQSLPWSGVNFYFAHCAIKLAHKREMPQTIQPDTFTVTQSYTERFFREVRAPEDRPSIVAAALGTEALLSSDFDPDGGMDYEVVAAVMALHSDKQPDVEALICADWGLPQDRVHITVRKIRNVLGDYFEIDQLPNTGPSGPR